MRAQIVSTLRFGIRLPSAYCDESWGGGSSPSTNAVKRARASGIVGTQRDWFPQPPLKAISYRPSQRATLVTVKAGIGSDRTGPAVCTIMSVLVWIFRVELDAIHATARDHLASQSAPTVQIMGCGGGAGTSEEAHAQTSIPSPMTDIARMTDPAFAVDDTTLPGRFDSRLELH